jgi:uncharacterized protein YecE (DUF72 family)
VTVQNYHLGCPIWSNPDWIGEFFTASARSSDFLRQYSSVFNTVEGNNTFYGLPAQNTVARWREEAAENFRFCFKFPRTISHERRLRNADAPTREFLGRLMPLTDSLGPLFLQLPPEFGPEDLGILKTYLDRLSAEFHYAVEVRHQDFFADRGAEEALNALLREHDVDRVLLDSRSLFSASPDDPETREAQRKKPRLPVRMVAIGKYPLIRFIGQPAVKANQPFLTAWVERVTEWIGEGRVPYIFTHTPNNRYAPQLARFFHGLLKERRVNVGELPPWPAARVANAQLPLF